MVSKYKALNQEKKRIEQENLDLANELARLKAGGVGKVATADPQMTTL